MKILSYVNGTAWQKITTTWKKNYVAQYDAGEMQSYNGTMTDKYAYEGSDYDPPGWGQSLYKWDGDGRSEEYTDSQGDDNTYSNFADPDLQITSLPDKDVTVIGTPPGWIYHYKADGIKYAWHLENSDGTYDTEATVDANIDMELYTGGKAKVGEQVLVEADISAVKYDKPPDGPWLGTPGENLDPTTLRILGKLAGSDGKVYASVPSGSEQPFNVVAPAGHYMAIANAGKYRLFVQANSSILQPDRVVPTANFCVGQYITFSPVWTPSIPAYTSDAAHWTLPGNFVNDYSVPAPPSNGSTTYFKNSALLNQESSSCWYVDGIPNADASVGMNLYFSNGQNVYVNSGGQFKMYRPTIAEWDPDYLGIPQVEIYSGSLSLGGGGHNVMSFQHLIQSDFSGTAGYTQLIDGEYDRDVSYSTDGYELDNTEWGRGQTTIHSPASLWYQNGVSWDDSPHIPLAAILNTTAMNLSFKTYLRFKPDVGPGPNIFVTLRLVTWKVTASATENDGVWTVDSGSSPDGPNDANSIDFPAWTEVFYNTPIP